LLIFSNLCESSSQQKSYIIFTRNTNKNLQKAILDWNKLSKLRIFSYKNIIKHKINIFFDFFRNLADFAIFDF